MLLPTVTSEAYDVTQLQQHYIAAYSFFHQAYSQFLFILQLRPGDSCTLLTPSCPAFQTSEQLLGKFCHTMIKYNDG